MKSVRRWQMLCLSISFSAFLVIGAIEPAKEELDKVIEDEITLKLGDDLLQSIERKFQVDLERSVDMVLLKIKLLLQNGTTHIQDRLIELQGQLNELKKEVNEEMDVCLLEKQNQTTALAEKALHQMVICGYALIGHDPAQAVKNVIALKNMIKQGLQPIHDKKKEIHNLMKLCGHDHDSLKKVIKCVISKSPVIKSSMMEVTGKLIEGVVQLTKLMAHGAMHEACLIEVVKTVEEETFDLVKEVKACAFKNVSNNVEDEVNKYIEENNATVLDINRNKVDTDLKVQDERKEMKEMKELIRRMLSADNVKDIDKNLKNKLMKLQKDLGSVDKNVVSNDVKNID